MRVNSQSLNVNTLQASNINKSTNKSSGKIAVTASRIQNSAEQCPVASKKKVCFSDVSQMKEFSSKEAPNKVSDTQSVNILTKTDEKTVHKKDITKLNNNVTAGLSKIKSKLDAILSDKMPGSFQKDVINELKIELKELTTSVNNYQNKLNSSSYAHNSSKQKTLTQLNNKLSMANDKISHANHSNKYNGIKNNQAYTDNINKANNFINGEKAPSKFND
ncbi:hypothetical protein ABN267_05685 [Providencia rettgeri]|uniref:Flagellar hook-length control protein FliK n=1 Tax=Providencia rettgeri TaxID=587 RepID=A0AAW6UGB3_PRORE|nr:MULTISPECIES: hypothetical protein [Providencia]MBG5892450.1 hypothetical protein [Providencia rettgeri]MBQ0530551.1 hypothetical protein [Providencia rettgeri]MDI9092443.1 hypothetical protein [Providencia rettgeri]MDT2034883.1 hypothetical protein [Providencia rettgeri]THB27984.1 hypothetical protein E6R27_06475 [Providencia sp. MGF014]